MRPSLTASRRCCTRSTGPRAFNSRRSLLEKPSLLKRAEKSLLDARALDPENAKIENYFLKVIHASLPRFEPPRESSLEAKIQDAVRCIKLPPMPSSDPRAVLLELWKTLSGLDCVNTDKRYSYRSKEKDNTGKEIVVVIRDRSSSS